MSITAMKQALEALEWYVQEDDVIESMVSNEYWINGKRKAEDTITSLRQAISEAELERLELIGHADLAINNIYIFNGYGEDVPEGRTPIYAGYKTTKEKNT